jgi:hypothetical protein
MTRAEFITLYPHMNYIHSDITTITILQTDTANNLMLYKSERPNYPNEQGFQYMNPSGVQNYYIFSVCGMPILIKKPNT